MAISSAAWDRLELTALFSGKGKWQTFAVRNASGIAFLGGELLTGGIDHSFSFNQFP